MDNKTILSFKIGRGGRFNNEGYLTFLDYDRPIKYYTDDLFGPIKPGATPDDDPIDDYSPDAEWTDDQGRSVGLTNAQYESGIGVIDYDGAYKTYYTKYLEDIDEKEAQVVLRDYIGPRVFTERDYDWLKSIYGIHPSVVIEYLINNDDNRIYDLEDLAKLLNNIGTLDAKDLEMLIDAHNSVMDVVDPERWIWEEGSEFIVRTKFEMMVCTDKYVVWDIDTDKCSIIE